MDGKPMSELNDLDRRIKAMFRPEMTSGTILEIVLINGFELFNTRPYHNYETWSFGYQALIDGRVVAQAEDLDVLVSRVEAWKEKQP